MGENKGSAVLLQRATGRNKVDVIRPAPNDPGSPDYNYFSHSILVTVFNDPPTPWFLRIYGRTTDSNIAGEISDVHLDSNGTLVSEPIVTDATVIIFYLWAAYDRPDDTLYADESARELQWFPSGSIWESNWNNSANFTMYVTLDFATMTFSASWLSTLAGTDDDEMLAWTVGADARWGAGGNDTLWGGVGQDSLYGEAGDDLLRGGDDDDLLDGGQGINKLWGDEGSDNFVHRLGNGHDKIMDFQSGDVLSLRGYSVGDRALVFADLDSNGDGILDCGDANVSMNQAGNLVLHLAAFGDDHRAAVVLRDTAYLSSRDLSFA